jgi:hypothetical protein
MDANKPQAAHRKSAIIQFSLSSSDSVSALLAAARKHCAHHERISQTLPRLQRPANNLLHLLCSLPSRSMALLSS